MRINIRLVLVGLTLVCLLVFVHWKAALAGGLLFAGIFGAERFLGKDYGKLFYAVCCFWLAYMLLNSIWGDILKSIKMMLAFALLKYGFDVLTNTYGFEPLKAGKSLFRYLVAQKNAKKTQDGE